MLLDLRLNGKERGEEKRRAFVCRLTDGRIAVLVPGKTDPVSFFPTLAAAKQEYAVLIPDTRIPMYDEYELKDVRRTLGMPITA